MKGSSPCKCFVPFIKNIPMFPKNVPMFPLHHRKHELRFSLNQPSEKLNTTAIYFTLVDPRYSHTPYFRHCLQTPSLCPWPGQWKHPLHVTPRFTDWKEPSVMTFSMMGLAVSMGLDLSPARHTVRQSDLCRGGHSRALFFQQKSHL